MVSIDSLQTEWQESKPDLPQPQVNFHEYIMPDKNPYNISYHAQLIP
jgi:hypothetical protein